MVFNKCVSGEKRKILLEQLVQYKREIIMTSDELQALEQWVSEGHSPYDNGDYIYDEDGQTMDFINALRFFKDLINETS